MLNGNIYKKTILSKFSCDVGKNRQEISIVSVEKSTCLYVLSIQINIIFGLDQQHECATQNVALSLPILSNVNIDPCFPHKKCSDQERIVPSCFTVELVVDCSGVMIFSAVKIVAFFVDRSVLVCP